MADYSGYVTVAHAAPAGWVLVKADLSDKAVVTALASVEVAVPPRRGILPSPPLTAWMAPDELLLGVARGGAEALVTRLEAALTGLPSLVLDVSDLRVGLVLGGGAVREVLAKLVPADMVALPELELCRSRLGQIGALIWLTSPDRAEVLVARSLADSAFILLSHAARPGSEIG